MHRTRNHWTTCKCREVFSFMILSLVSIVILKWQYHSALMGIFNPSEQCSREYDASLNITEPLANCINTASDGHSCGYFQSPIRQVKQSYYSSVSCNLRAQLQLSLDLATTKGASVRLSALPLSEYGFTLHKSAFHDAVALRYGWPLSQIPSHCACRTNFSI